jgi:hypothetical protein
VAVADQAPDEDGAADLRFGDEPTVHAVAGGEDGKIGKRERVVGRAGRGVAAVAGGGKFCERI